MNQTAQRFRQHFKRFSNECQLPSRYLNWVFKVSASCNNTKSKSLSKWQDCLISELLWQIIPYWSKAVFSSAMLVGFGIYRPSILERKQQSLQWNLQNMWSESSSLSTVNLEKNLLQFQRYRIFPRGLLFFGAPCTICTIFIINNIIIQGLRTTYMHEMKLATRQSDVIFIWH